MSTLFIHHKIIALNIQSQLHSMAATFVRLQKASLNQNDPDYHCYTGYLECESTAAYINYFLSRKHIPVETINFSDDHVISKISWAPHKVHYLDMTYKQFLLPSDILNRYVSAFAEGPDTYYEYYDPPYPSRTQFANMANYIAELNQLPTLLVAPKSQLIPYLSKLYSRYLKFSNSIKLLNWSEPVESRAQFLARFGAKSTSFEVRTESLEMLLKAFQKMKDNDGIYPASPDVFSRFGRISTLNGMYAWINKGKTT
jgi:hypothetical protein